MEYIVVFITASTRKEAKYKADGVIDSRLAACVNIMPKIESVYTWKGKKETSKEYLLIAKTKKSLFNRLKVKVKKLHSYSTPEIIALPIIAGYKGYLDWINEVLR